MNYDQKQNLFFQALIDLLVSLLEVGIERLDWIADADRHHRKAVLHAVRAFRARDPYCLGIIAPIASPPEFVVSECGRFASLREDPESEIGAQRSDCAPCERGSPCRGSMHSPHRTPCFRDARNAKPKCCR